MILLSSASHAAKEAKLDAATQKQVVEKVKEYCVLMQELSGDVEKIDNMETIYAMCENSNVSVFNDLAVASTKDISDNSMPLQQYMMMLTDKFEHNVKTSYSGYKYIKTIVQPSPLKDFDATTYAFVKVDKQVNTVNFKSKQHLNVIVNIATMKVSSTISEDYEDPQRVYLEALEMFNNGDYKKAIPMFEKVSVLPRFSGRYRAKSMLGWVYAEQKEFQKAYELLRASSADDPLGGIILASKILIRDDVPVTLRNTSEAGSILKALMDVRDKDFPTLHLIAKSAIVDAYDISNVRIKINTTNAESIKIAESLISDPLSTDAFKVRGYYLKCWNVGFSKDLNKVKEGLACLTKAEESLKRANLDREGFEYWDTQLLLMRFFVNQRLGDQDEMIKIVKSMLYEKPYAAGFMALSFVSAKDYKTALEYYRKAAEYGNPYANYLVSLSCFPLHNPLLGYEDRWLADLYKKIIGKISYNSNDAQSRKQNEQLVKNLIEFTYFLVGDKNQKRSNEEYLKWLQRAVDLGDVSAMEDKAYWQVTGMLPGIERNISQGLRLLCSASQAAERSKSIQAIHIYSEAVYLETNENNIPYLQSETYKTLKALAEEGNGAAAYFLSCNLPDTVQAKNYLKQGADAKYFYAMFDYACDMEDQGMVDMAYNLFLELTMYPFSYAYGHLGDIERNHRHNYKQALKYYSEGRKERDYLSYEGLSDMYKEGIGCEKNLKFAKEYIRLAMANYKSDFGYDEINPSAKMKLLMEKKNEIDRLIAAGGDANAPASSMTQLNQVLDNKTSEDERITLSQNVLSEVFASPKAVVKTVGSNGKTIVSTETAEDFLLRLATLKTDKKIIEVSSKKDKNNKYTELTVQMK